MTTLEAVAHALDAAAQWQRAINAFISIERERALDAARILDAAGGAGHMALAHKDMFDRRGRSSTCGSCFIEPVADRSATVIERLEHAGAVAIGTLNMAEFALGPTGHNAVFGHCRNPWDRTRISGGSSSGPAAAVAAGIVAGSLGSDTGGSIRIPAACCGVVGLKPTQGRVSVAGVMPLAPSLDCVGPFARSAAECETLFRMIAGPDPRDPASQRQPDIEPDAAVSIESGRLAFPRESLLRDCDSEVIGALEEAVRHFAACGSEVVPAVLPDIPRLHELANVIQQSEAAHVHAVRLAQSPELYTPHIRERIEPGQRVTATAYLSAAAQRSSLQSQFVAETLIDAHALVLPVIGMPVPTIDETDEAALGGSSEIVGRMTRWTRWVNYLGMPALSIPCGRDRRGLPVGLQLIGRPFSEITLLAIARGFQASTDWHARRPPLPGVPSSAG
ncbi:MAG: amidase [Proteobacteria bacterium]|nr:amidase [Pseudomonadota bacterium]